MTPPHVSLRGRLDPLQRSNTSRGLVDSSPCYLQCGKLLPPPVEQLTKFESLIDVKSALGLTILHLLLLRADQTIE